MIARVLAFIGLSSLVIFTAGCKKSVNCSPGTHADKGQCAPDVATNAPADSGSAIAVVASAAPSASAVSSASLAPEKPKRVQQLEAIIAAAGDQFRSAHGPLEKESDKYEFYKTSLLLEGCEQPAIWKLPSAEWQYRCDIVTNKNGQNERDVLELLHPRIDAMIDAIPTDWKFTRKRKAEAYVEQFRAVDPTRHIVIRSYIVPRVDKSADATFEVLWYPKAQTE